MSGDRAHYRRSRPCPAPRWPRPEQILRPRRVGRTRAARRNPLTYSSSSTARIVSYTKPSTGGTRLSQLFTHIVRDPSAAVDRANEPSSRTTSDALDGSPTIFFPSALRQKEGGGENEHRADPLRGGTERGNCVPGGSDQPERLARGSALAGPERRGGTPWPIECHGSQAAAAPEHGHRSR